MTDDQDDLFGSSYPERPGTVTTSDTSVAAANSLRDEDLTALRRRCWEYIAARPAHGATCDEIEVALDLRHQTASARLRELALAGRIEDSGERRQTRSKRDARVYLARGRA